MAIEAVIFDWGGTLSSFVSAELVDVWRLAARHLAPDREDEVTAVLVAVEAEFWATTATHQRSTTLGDLMAAASDRLGLDVAEALLEEAAVRHLDAWTEHVVHDPDAAPTLRALRERGLRIGLLSNTHWPRAFHERFLERDGLAELIDARLYTSEMPFQKPHPSAFEATLRGARRRAARCRGVRGRPPVGRRGRRPADRHAHGAAPEQSGTRGTTSSPTRSSTSCPSCSRSSTAGAERASR